jgi:hypothetical protein
MAKAGNQQTTQPDAPPTGASAISNFWGRVSQFLAPRPASKGQAQAAAQPGQKPPVGLGKMVIGLAAYMIGSMALEYIILAIDNGFKLHLSTTTQTLFPTSWPLVGNMTKFALIYLLLLLAYVWLLFRLNVIPRDLFRPRQSAARGNASTTTAASAGRSKSARRRAGLTAAAATTAAAKHHPTTRRSGAGARAARAESSADTGSADDEYERVRSLMRRRRKR